MGMDALLPRSTTNGDVAMMLAKSQKKKGLNNAAKQTLGPLSRTDSHCLIALAKLQMEDNSVKGVNKAMKTLRKKSDFNIDAAKYLAKILKEKELFDDAIDILQRYSYDAEVVDAIDAIVKLKMKKAWGFDLDK